MLYHYHITIFIFWELLMKSAFLFLFPLMLAFNAQAESSPLNYPELMVVPKASERLNIEANRSEQNSWSNHLPLHVASATTLVAGLMTLNNLENEDDDMAPKIAIAVGAGWLATSIWLQTSYQPYKSGLNEVKKISGPGLRSQLAAERLAEEHIDQASRLAKKIKWISFVTNAGATLALVDAAEKDSAAQGVAMLGVLTSFLPVVFPLNWEQVSRDHNSYKKKVFGPLTFSNGLLLNPVNQKPTMGLIVGVSFN